MYLKNLEPPVWAGVVHGTNKIFILDRSFGENRYSPAYARFYVLVSVDGNNFRRCKAREWIDTFHSISKYPQEDGSQFSEYTVRQSYTQNRDRVIELFYTAVHISHLERFQIPFSSPVLRRARVPGTREAHCWSCRSKINNRLYLECSICSWIVCPCGACGCGWQGYTRERG